MVAPGLTPTPPPVGAVPVSVIVFGKVSQMSVFPNPPMEPEPSQVATAPTASPSAIQAPKIQVVDSSGSVSLRRTAVIASSISWSRRPPHTARPHQPDLVVSVLIECRYYRLSIRLPSSPAVWWNSRQPGRLSYRHCQRNASMAQGWDKRAGSQEGRVTRGQGQWTRN